MREKDTPLEWGIRIRKLVDKAFMAVYPYLRVIIPNLRIAHYFYIITWIIIGSIFFYPVKNIAYIDALYFATGASTQSGLNTIDVNQLVLWQQMCLYIITTLTTPIFIHGSLLFIRLYGFERYFDNIKETSRLNNRMRRAATIGSRTRSFDHGTSSDTRANTDYNTGYNTNNTENNTNFNTGYNTYPDPEPRELEEIHEVKDETTVVDHSPPSSSTQEYGYDQGRYDQGLSSDVEHISEPSDSENSVHRDHLSDESSDDFERASSPSNLTPGGPLHIRNLLLARTQSPKTKPQVQIQAPPATSLVGTSQATGQATGASPSGTTTGEGIKFGALPLPVKRTYEVDPKHMYMSIEMLQQSNKSLEDDDDVLIIKSPNQIENENGEHPIFTKKFPGIQFSDDNPILKNKLRRKVKAKLKQMRSMSMNLIEDENDSIDSQDEGDEIGDTQITDYDEDAVSDNQNETETDEEHVTRAQSHLAIPTENTGGKKYTRRANTFDIRGSKTPERRGARAQRTRSRFSLAPRTSTNDEENSLFTSISHTLSNPLTRLKTTNYLSWEPTIGRNSNFVHLSDEQKEELGGVEYRAIKLLVKIVSIYYIGFHIIAVLVYLGWILARPQYKEIIRGFGISPVWWGFFTGQTSFNDLGYTLTPNSMISFNESLYVMIWGAFFIVIGNTGFPILLRFIIWVMYKFATPMSLVEESLSFLLDHPRRCFTLLFPSGPTWWLFAILVILNGIDLIFFIILDLNNSYLEKIPAGYRVMCGLFNAVSTRTAGLSVVDISQLHAAVQVGYVIMMYISVLPLAISIRRTNVYEEQSLGVYIKDNNLNHEDDVNAELSPRNFIGNHLRNQLSFDLWFVFLGLFIICIAENGRLEKDEIRFTVFTILFECVSAYGTVGLSLGYPTANTSFSGEFTTISKLIMIAMMIRGRHRGLPYALDRAIMLPSDNMLKRDEVQEHHIARRTDTIERSQTLGTSGTIGTSTGVTTGTAGTTTGTNTGISGGSDLFRAITRRGNEFIRRRMSSAGY